MYVFGFFFPLLPSCTGSFYYSQNTTYYRVAIRELYNYQKKIVIPTYIFTKHMANIGYHMKEIRKIH